MKRISIALLGALLLVLLVPVFEGPTQRAAIPATAIWELNSGANGSNVNAGGFDPGDSANMATDLACTSATGNAAVCTSASYNFAAGDAPAPSGNWLYIKTNIDAAGHYGPTGSTGCWYSITSVATNAATVNSTLGAGVCTFAALGYPVPRFVATTTAGVADTASPTGGTWSVDYSQYTAANNGTTGDLASTVGTTDPCVVTSASYTFGVNTVGNFIHVTAGSNWTADWYTIVSVAAGAATLDKACGSNATLSSGTWRIGGAMSMNSTLDDDLMEKGIAGNRFFVKNGSAYSFGEAMTISAAGGTQLPIVIEGYNSLRGDTPTGSSRPSWNLAGNTMTLGTRWDTYSMSFTGTASIVVQLGTDGKLVNSKVVNTSTTAGRVAVTCGSDSWLFKTEANSYRGIAINMSSFTCNVHYSYAHDSATGINSSATTNPQSIVGNIAASNLTAAMSIGAVTAPMMILGNTFVGGVTKVGTCISIASGMTDMKVLNNIIYGCTTGISNADTQSIVFGDYNFFYNNTNNVSAGGQWQLGANGSTTINPGFVNVAEYTQTGTVTTTTTQLTDTGANFANVVDNQDFLVMTAGSTCTTPLTNTKVLITSHDATHLTVSTALSASGTCDSVTYIVSVGHNYAIGTNLKAFGYPGLFPGGLTTGYMDPGAVQRQESGTGGGGGPFIR